MRRLVLTLGMAGAVACSPPAFSQQPVTEQRDTGSRQAATTPPMTPPTTDEEKVALALSAAPADISKNAAVMDMGADRKMKELRPGTNGWVCMAQPEVMCVDKEWQQFLDAWMKKTDPQVSTLGFAYMLRGDTGASNTDPFATAPTPDNHWIVSPAHLMILTPDARQLEALPADPTSGGPWVMWKGTPYAHVMVPVAPMPAGAVSR